MTEVHPSHADLESSQGLSVVQMSMNQPIQVQSVIHPNQPSVIQTAGPNVQTIQVVRVSIHNIPQSVIYNTDCWTKCTDHPSCQGKSYIIYHNRSSIIQIAGPNVQTIQVVGVSHTTIGHL
jgi:hypothetical protein